MRVLLGVELALAAGALACGSSPPASNGTCQQSAAVRVCGGGSVVHGVDVSKYQGTVDWAQVKAAGIVFAFARISDGTANPDADFAANWRGMESNGVVRGAYQYFRASVDPTAQANLVASSLKSAGGLHAGDLPVVMDLETADGQSESTIEANMRTWLAAVEAQTGRTPIIYSSAGTYPVTTTAFASYPLWVANYGATCPSLPAGWSQWRFWQTSSSGTVNGIAGSVDLDEYDGTLADLTTFAGGAAADSGVRPAVDGGGPSDAGTRPPGGGGISGDAGPGLGSGAASDGGSLSGVAATSDAGADGDGGAAMGRAGDGTTTQASGAGRRDASTGPCAP